ncbi:YusW family protein [Bacillus salacetis]|uniref:YusW family protein n=1 Tax=Bacillus salacetis TaxID=2315464 RepID=UPI003B9FBFE2
MKKTLSVLTVLSMSVLLGACAEDENAADNTSGNQEVVVEDEETNTLEEGEEVFTDDRSEGIKFDYFEMNVEYPDMIETAYQVEYEKENDGLEASIDDNLNGQEKDGAQAFETLYPIFSELDFDENTSQEDLVSQIVSQFNLREDFEWMEVDIDLSNGETIEFEAETS